MIIMQTNNSFSFQRFLLLIRLSLRVNKKLMMITIAGLAGTLFLCLFLFQSMSDFHSWDQASYIATFIFLFLFLGLLYTSQSFPAFRSNTKSLAYLTLPASNTEKYVFELLTRIVAFIIFMPVVFWIIANIEGAIVHKFVPQLTDYKFLPIESFFRFMDKAKPGFWGILGIIQSILFVFIAAFAGASHFSKSPLIKTLFTFSIIVAGFFMFSLLLYKGLKMKEYESTEKVTISKERILMLFAIAGSIINLSLLAFAWFRLKEKEA